MSKIGKVICIGAGLFLALVLAAGAYIKYQENKKAEEIKQALIKGELGISIKPEKVKVSWLKNSVTIENGVVSFMDYPLFRIRLATVSVKDVQGQIPEKAQGRVILEVPVYRLLKQFDPYRVQELKPSLEKFKIDEVLEIQADGGWQFKKEGLETEVKEFSLKGREPLVTLSGKAHFPFCKLPECEKAFTSAAPETDKYFTPDYVSLKIKGRNWLEILALWLSPNDPKALIGAELANAHSFYQEFKKECIDLKNEPAICQKLDESYRALEAFLKGQTDSLELVYKIKDPELALKLAQQKVVSDKEILKNIELYLKN
ncbi:hypothetical protein [Thermodesulfatator indicus]